tara:strand:- start:142 stop:369 length:228 start_codon:yes stop_codon:yes gene_type:complete
MKCFNYHKKNKKECVNKSCRYWIDNKKSQSCCIIAASKEKSYTLEDIGKFFNITRMRICQIEKKALSKVKEVFLK